VGAEEGEGFDDEHEDDNCRGIECVFTDGEGRGAERVYGSTAL